jgi:hypothetical protein
MLQSTYAHATPHGRVVATIEVSLVALGEPRRSPIPNSTPQATDEHGRELVEAATPRAGRRAVRMIWREGGLFERVEHQAGLERRT